MIFLWGHNYFVKLNNEDFFTLPVNTFYDSLHCTGSTYT